MKCPNCIDGNILGIFPLYSDDIPIEQRKRTIVMKCKCCLGSGTIDNERLKKIKIGEKIREKRIKEELTLREYCKKNNISVFEQSKLERGF